MVKDKFSKMDKEELCREIKRLTFTINSGRGLPVRDIGGYGYSDNSEKILRQFLRFLYENLKPEYIDKIRVVESLDDQNDKGGPQ